MKEMLLKKFWEIQMNDKDEQQYKSRVQGLS